VSFIIGLATTVW